MHINRSNYHFERVASDAVDQIREILSRSVMITKYTEFEQRTQPTD